MLITTAQQNEIDAALSWLFRDEPLTEQSNRIETTRRLLSNGELDQDGLFVARENGAIVGATLAYALPGRAGLMWAPQSDDESLALTLGRMACEYLEQRQVAFISTFLLPEAKESARLLETIGFRLMTRVWYLSLTLTLAELSYDDDDRLSLMVYEDCIHDRFVKTLMATYEGSLDCPELNGLRSPDEIIAGHRNEARTPPDWFLIERDGEPIGVLLLTPNIETTVCELVYLGVVGSARKVGIGRMVLNEAIRRALAIGQYTMWLSVDSRNEPAMKLYRRMGFRPFDCRDVWLQPCDRGID